VSGEPLTTPAGSVQVQFVGWVRVQHGDQAVDLSLPEVPVVIEVFRRSRLGAEPLDDHPARFDEMIVRDLQGSLRRVGNDPAIGESAAQLVSLRVRRAT
jgi:hypothetical protein